MKEEKEIKLEIIENIETKKIISELKKVYGIHFKTKIETQDIYYDTNELKFFNLNHGLRIRIDNGTQFFLTYKALFNIPERETNPWFVFEKDINLKNTSKTEINNLLKIANLPNHFNQNVTLDSVVDYLEKIGLHKSIEIFKTRLESKNEGFSMFIDVIEGLGIFIEIEAENHILLNQLLNKIPFDFDLTRLGYTNLYMSRVLGEAIPDFAEKFKKDCNWNYLKGQKEIIDELIKEN